LIYEGFAEKLIKYWSEVEPGFPLESSVDLITECMIGLHKFVKDNGEYHD
jgi:hypothetical protein